MQSQSAHHHYHHSSSSNSNHDGGGGGGGGGGGLSGGSGSSGYAKTWELNQYELNRLPHEIIYDDRTIAVSPKVLQNELMCPICLDILKHTMTTKECLHRFCQECIITALRAGNKECPTCRKKLISKRSLREDPNFDAIIAKIYPNREEYDALHEKVLEKLNKKHLTAFVTHSISGSGGGSAVGAGSNNTSSNNAASRGGSSSSNRNNRAATTATSSPALQHSNGNSDATPSSNGKGLKRSSTSAVAVAAALANSEDESDMESRTSTEQSSTHYGYQADSDEIELILKPHPLKETTLTSKRFLKTTANATMTHLSKYLWTRLCVEAGQTTTEPHQPSQQQQQQQTATDSDTSTSNATEFQLFLHQTKSAYVHLEPQLTLEQLIEQHWKQNRPIELFYYHNVSPSKRLVTAAGGSSKSHLNDANSNSSNTSSTTTTSSSMRSNSNTNMNSSSRK